MEMSDLLNGAVPESELVQNAVSGAEPVELKALLRDGTQNWEAPSLPTPDVHFLPKGPNINVSNFNSGFFIWCANTQETWWVPDESSLNVNFIYRDDLEIYEINDKREAEEWVHTRNDGLLPGLVTSKSCYI
ncbi:MAG: hypothetical protein NC489_30180, partial [Ruminococcus flavefaciens]|nr:hypothetical protein [Ruminococcus flavefaciens]